jgi:hypothetical protein
VPAASVQLTEHAMNQTGPIREIHQGAVVARRQKYSFCFNEFTSISQILPRNSDIFRRDSLPTIQQAIGFTAILKRARKMLDSSPLCYCRALLKYLTHKFNHAQL